MAGELVKWSGGKLAKPGPVEKSRQAREAALALLRPREIPVRPMGQDVAVSSRPYPGLIVDLPRVCAVHDRPYAARYVFGNDGLFRLGSMIVVTEALYMHQYAGNGSAVTVPETDIREETCPLCGAFGFGSVLCHVCKTEVCYGRTSGLYFRCRPSCPGKGEMRSSPKVHRGVTPVDMRWR